jgi:hypothetical protein
MLYDSDILVGSHIIQADAKLGIITVLNLDNFQTIKTIFVPIANHGRYEDKIYGLFRSIKGSHFIVFTADYIQIFDISTFTKIKEIQRVRKLDVIASLDKQTIQSGLKWALKEVECFDMNTLTYFTKKEEGCRKIYPKSTKYSKNLLNIYEYEDWHYPYIHRIYDDAPRNALYWLDDKKFYQLIDNMWLIITPDGYFDGSPEARKYFYIKTPSGESVPIDDATYNKFHKQISIENK